MKFKKVSIHIQSQMLLEDTYTLSIFITVTLLNCMQYSALQQGS